MNTSIVGHGNVRNGVIQAGAVALLLGAVFAANGARAAENVEPEEPVRPGVPAMPPQPPAPPVAVAPAPETRADRAAPRRSESEMRELNERLREAQERLNRAANEVAVLAAERAADAMEGFPWLSESSRRTVIGVQLSNEGKDGARVVDVSPGGPAEMAGVRAGDVIVSLNGKDVKGNSSREVVRLLREVKPETRVKVGVLRAGKPMTFDVVARPYSAFAYHEDAPPGPPGEPSRGFGNFGPFTYRYASRDELAGLEVTTLTPQLGRYFGTEKGVLVVRAPKSDVYKLQDGDVIVSIDGREPTSGSHITRILSSYQPGEKLTMRVMRDRKAQDIAITVPDNRGNARTRTSWLLDPAL